MTRPRFVWPCVWETARAYRGLGLWRTGLFLRYHPEYQTPPFGWRYLHMWDRDAFILVPLWFYGFALAWKYRYYVTFRPLMALGLWTVRPGDYYVAGHLTAPAWFRRFAQCFLSDADGLVVNRPE